MVWQKGSLIVKQLNLKWGCHMENEEFMEQVHPMKLMIFVNQLHRRLMERCLEGTGLHRAQHRMLMFLADHEIEAQSDLAKGLQVSTATVTVSLKKLERDGYIRKTSKKSDSRVNFVELTEEGRHIVEKSRLLIESMDEKTLEGFCEEEVKELRIFLKRIYDNLSGIAADQNERSRR